MQNRSSEELFALIKGMSPSEKKSFHLYARRNTNNVDMKVLSVYAAINAMKEYNEKALVNKVKNIKPGRLPQLKVNLYNLLLDSLCLVKRDESILLQLHQLMEHARILCDKGFHIQASKALKRLKGRAADYQQVSFLFQAVVLEKKIELVYGNCEPERIELLNKEMRQHSEQLALIGHLSNQSMLLYGWLNKYGCIRNEEDEKFVNDIYNPTSHIVENKLPFYPRLYLLQLKTYYYLIKKHSFFYGAASAWVGLFENFPEMKKVEELQYHRGLAYLNEAAFQKKERTILKGTIDNLRDARDHFYLLVAELNSCLVENSCDEAFLESALAVVKTMPQNERQIILCHKAAQLCLNQSGHKQAIDFTHRGLNIKSGVRLDLQYQLRLLQIEAHREAGNIDIIEHLQRSTSRFAAVNRLNKTLFVILVV